MRWSDAWPAVNWIPAAWAARSTSICPICWLPRKPSPPGWRPWRGRERQAALHLDRDIQTLELSQGFAYAPEQREAIRQAVTENCLVLTGGPGTGKTTTVKAILNLLESRAERVALCAPTGRAAKRLSELTGRKASTIHRLLEVDYSGGVVTFIHNEKNLLKCDVVILDEMSMVDVQLFQSLLAALRPACRGHHGGGCRSAAQRRPRQHPQ